MKVFAILLCAILLWSCEEEDRNGLCNAYDENGEYVRCLSDKSKAECAKLDSDQHLGNSWEFSTADICGPPNPGN